MGPWRYLSASLLLLILWAGLGAVLKVVLTHPE
jgi:hypothetical protein